MYEVFIVRNNYGIPGGLLRGFGSGAAYHLQRIPTIFCYFWEYHSFERTLHAS